MAASHQGPQCCQGRPGHMLPSSDWIPTAKGSLKLPGKPQASACRDAAGPHLAARG